MVTRELRVLVIEDAEFDAVLLVNLLRHGGYQVTWKRVETAGSMKQALATQTWDLVFSDHQMPEFSAPEALALLQETGLDLPFIIVSGGIGEATAVAAMKAGAHDYLIKGQLGRLIPAVERELREAANREARRQAERSLRESELRYRLLWANSPDAVVLMDAQGLINFVNPAVEKVFGYTPLESVGQNFLFLLAQEVLDIEGPGLRSPWQPAAAGPRQQMLETVGRHKAGQDLPVEIAFADMELEGRRYYVAFIRDISERKRAELALREKEEQLRVARDIQQRLFPKSPPALPGYDLAGASFPAEATGGDYFDYLAMLDEGTGIVIGDVSGHGIGSALLMADTRAYLRIVAMNRHQVSEVLNRANRALAEDVGSERFVTLLLARLDPALCKLAYVNAGHPAAYILAADGRVKQLLKRSGPPLGIKLNTVYVDSGDIALEAGDLVFFLTDGIEEAMAPDNTLYGVDRALEVVRTCRDLPARDIVEALRASVLEFTGHAPQLDDLTAVVLKVLGTRTSTP